jgi:hypothetical protein
MLGIGNIGSRLTRYGLKPQLAKIRPLRRHP